MDYLGSERCRGDWAIYDCKNSLSPGPRWGLGRHGKEIEVRVADVRVARRLVAYWNVLAPLGVEMSGRVIELLGAVDDVLKPDLLPTGIGDPLTKVEEAIHQLRIVRAGLGPEPEDENLENPYLEDDRNAAAELRADERRERDRGYY